MKQGASMRDSGFLIAAACGALPRCRSCTGARFYGTSTGELEWQSLFGRAEFRLGASHR